MDEQQRQTINAQSTAVARLAETYFRSKGAKQISDEAFLPYRKETPTPEATLTPQTARVLKRLLRAGKIPPRIASKFVKDLAAYREE